MLQAIPGCLPAIASTGRAVRLALPKGTVAVFGVLSLLCFLAEGTVLDWSGVFLVMRGADLATAGLGYAVFALAMAAGRLFGDLVRSLLGDSRVLLLGAAISALGFLVIVLVANQYAMLAGYLMIGIGASNIVPVLFSAAGRSKDMPRGLAVGSVTTMGYLGLLLGPGLIGVVAHWTGLAAALGIIGIAMVTIASQYRLVGR